MYAFQKSIHLSVITLVLGLLSVAGGATSAHAASVSVERSPVVLQLLGKSAHIRRDGSIVIRWRSNCPETYQGFSYYVRVAQTSGSNYFDVYEAGALVCDGKTRVIRTKTVPFDGEALTRGPADVEVAAFYSDEVRGNDTEARDFATFKLRGCVA